MGYAVAQLTKALRYKPQGRGFHSRWSHWDFSLTWPWSTQPVTQNQGYLLGLRVAGARPSLFTFYFM